MELVTKRDMADARKLIELCSSLPPENEGGWNWDEFIHDIAQAIADGRRPDEAPNQSGS